MCFHFYRQYATSNENTSNVCLSRCETKLYTVKLYLSAACHLVICSGEVFHTATKDAAVGMGLAHNHPFREISPSHDNIELT